MRQPLILMVILIPSHLGSSTTIHNGVSDLNTPKIDTKTKEEIHFNTEETVFVSYYHAVSSQTDDTPLITADMSKIDTNVVDDLRWCAITRDMHSRFDNTQCISFGDTIIIVFEDSITQKEIGGKYVVHDIMSKRYEHGIDILISEERSKKKVFNIGRWKNVKIKYSR